jgi:phosphate acyltransferase
VTSSDSAVARVAVDILGGHPVPGIPGALLDSLLGALEADTHLALTLVGPVALLADALADRGVTPGGRVSLADGPEFVGDGDAGRAVRAHRRASVRVAARLVRDGAADASVTRGPVAAATVAAEFVLGRVPGVTRAALARVSVTPAGPVVLLDTSTGPDATPDQLAQFALLGAAYAAARFGLQRPRVGLLSTGTDASSSGDALRRASLPLLARLPVAFVGPVTADVVAAGGVADVVVTDGFTGAVLVAALDGARRVAGNPTGGTELDPGGVILGIDGVVVRVGGEPAAAAGAVAAAARLHRAALPAATRAAMADLVADRRVRAGLPA